MINPPIIVIILAEEGDFIMKSPKVEDAIKATTPTPIPCDKEIIIPVLRPCMNERRNTTAKDGPGDIAPNKQINAT